MRGHFIRAGADRPVAAGEWEKPVAAGRRATWRDYVEVTKPGITISNLMMTFGAFWLASGGQPDWAKLVVTLFGTYCAVVSGAILNNYFDRDRDILMPRTKNRALAQQRIAPHVALTLAIFMGVLSLCVLGGGLTAMGGNGGLPALLAFIGIVTYGLIYTGLKRYTALCTLFGGIPGSIPFVIGWTAVVGKMDYFAWVLFFVMFLWQMPHFLTLAVLKVEDYKAGKFPMLPVVRGVEATIRQVFLYTAALLPASLFLVFSGLVGWLYVAVMTVLGVCFVVLAASGFWTKDTNAWAVRNFRFSLIYLTVWCLVMIIDAHPVTTTL
ncbi:MAG: protoheme IX farnesyltransferase [Bacillaceae bacterium G1]|nr:protoheme IX farnesyltransferase [Bacillota bacterium]OJF17496.1 MAG: protoheme IX farnesyltransferase [Bacillaceae bacterium G1]